jgi:hypothetical protein
MATVPAGRPTAERKREYDSNHLANQALFAGRVGKPLEAEKPLTHPKHMGVWHDKDRAFKRRGHWHTVWRSPNGKFAEKPPLGERAKRMYPFGKKGL